MAPRSLTLEVEEDGWTSVILLPILRVRLGAGVGRGDRKPVWEKATGNRFGDARYRSQPVTSIGVFIPAS